MDGFVSKDNNINTLRQRDMSKTCRLCGVSHEISKLILLFGAKSNKMDLCDKIHQYTPFKIEPNDNFPKYMCTECISKINQWDVFLKSCLEVQQKLKTLVTENNQSTLTDTVNSSSNKNICQHAAANDETEAMAPPIISGQVLPKKNMIYCIALWCNNNKRRLPGVSLFRVPKDSLRANEWLTNAGRQDILHLEIKQINTKYICAEHFNENMFMNSTRKKLVWNAVPTIFPKPDSCNGKPAKQPRPNILSATTSANFRKLLPKPTDMVLLKQPSDFQSNPTTNSRVTTTLDHNLTYDLIKTKSAEKTCEGVAEPSDVSESSGEANHAGHFGEETMFDTHCEENMYLVEPSSEKVHCCVYCGEMFLVKSSLISHQMTYHSDQTVGCDMCGHASYKSKSEFMEHVCQHSIQSD